MSKKIKVSINQPCQEKFESFKPTRTGGFCDSCQKNVVDFSNMSDSEILNYLKHNKGDTCGRFKKSQLKEYTETPLLNTERNSIAARAGLLSIPFLSLFPVANSQAQSAEEQSSTPIHQGEITEQSTDMATNPEDSLVSGIVRDGNETIPFVSVHLKGSSVGTSTDIDGKFEFPEPLKKGDTLVFSFLGYETQEYVIQDKSNLNINLEINLNEQEIVLMGEVSVEQKYSSRKTLLEKLKALF